VANSKTLRRRQQEIAAFGEALTRLLDVCEPHERLAAFPTWAARPGQEPEASRRTAELDRVAGRAAQAFGTDFFIEWKPRGTWQTQPVSPAMGWRTIFDYDPNFGVDVIFAVCHQAIGAIDARATEAEEHEQSLAGKVERVIGREPSGSGHVRGIAVGFVVALIAALVAAYLAFRFGWV
jgi:hypothetical protein